MRLGSICSGIGGLELGLERAGLGETVWQAEIDPHASEVLARHWDVPNLGDFRESGFPDCDVLVGGFPCQPVSTAGRRAGTEDERWLFDDIVDALGRMGSPPRLCVFENVRGLLSANGGAAMGRVVHGLASVGFVGRYGLLRAADVGACHRRERVFIVAHAEGGVGADGPGVADEGRPLVGSGSGAGSRAGSGGSAEGVRELGRGERLARPASPDPNFQGPQGRDLLRERGRERPAGSDRLEVPTDTKSAERRGTQQQDLPPLQRGWDAQAEQPGVCSGSGDRPDWGAYAAAVARWATTLGRPAPPPTTDGRLSPDFVCWMMGFPEGWVDGLSRTAALRCLGNAVVPQVAEMVGRDLAPLVVAA